MNEQIKMKKQKTILMVVFEFPPSNGASVPRIESFYRYLKQWGWNVVVLTATDRAYSKIDRTYTDAADDKIYRANAYDVQRDLSYKGKYLSIMETPDRWGLTWIPAALKTGKKLLKNTSQMLFGHRLQFQVHITLQINWRRQIKRPGR
ncbi:hypothetical protein [Psychrosphaera algicola]|uniref:Glycosyltransferase subfamily 4-like N-terminal domain-containing protein n=1 Tax=Psychrosphaera algicola TaxID=3023714 RepID=A0ABT5FET0_9GAMM|nr:hypothetical protein [Psychrosphaera sp. G1-22]MDC2890018.1 hypothetical protein [Psychrosphaera sp. G1-22]